MLSPWAERSPVGVDGFGNGYFERLAEDLIIPRNFPNGKMDLACIYWDWEEWGIERVGYKLVSGKNNKHSGQTRESK